MTSLLDKALSMDTQSLKQRLIHTRNELYYHRSLYCEILNAFAKVQHMTYEEVLSFYPWLLDPIKDAYRLDQSAASNMIDTIVNKCQYGLLLSIVQEVESESIRSYPSDFT